MGVETKEGEAYIVWRAACGFWMMLVFLPGAFCCKKCSKWWNINILQPLKREEVLIPWHWRFLAHKTPKKGSSPDLYYIPTYVILKLVIIFFSCCTLFRIGKNIFFSDLSYTGAPRTRKSSITKSCLSQNLKFALSDWNSLTILLLQLTTGCTYKAC